MFGIYYYNFRWISDFVKNTETFQLYFYIKPSQIIEYLTFSVIVTHKLHIAVT